MSSHPKSNQEIIEYFVCGECGGKLSLIKVFCEGEQVYCLDCSKTHTGVLPEVYELADKYCDNHFFGYYSRDLIRDDEARLRANRGKMCDIIKWVEKRLEESSWKCNGPSLPKTKILYCHRCAIPTAHSPAGCLTCELDDYDLRGGE